MKKDEYYKRLHEKELKSLNEVVRKIKKGIFFIVSVRLDKEMMGGGGYRLTVYLRENEGN